MKHKKKNRVRETQVVEPQPAETIKDRRPTLIAIIAGSMAVLMIAAALIIILVTLNDRYVKVYEDPHVRIRLSNGAELNFIIWEQNDAADTAEEPKVSYAAKNFIYLCNIGYFNDAVLYAATESQAISDGFARFGGFLESGKHRGDNENEFWEKVDRMAPGGLDYGKNPFGYRLNKDTTSRASSYKGMVGILSFSYQRTATEFQITVNENTTSTVGGETWEYCAFGEAADDKTRDAILQIAALNTEEESRFTGHSYFKTLLDDNGEIRIKSVRVGKMLRDFWKDFDFMTYFMNESGTARNGLKSGWSYSAQKKTGAI